jgi:hypothetical protein
VVFCALLRRARSARFCAFGVLLLKSVSVE